MWDGDGAESAVSTVDSLGDDDLDECGYANMSVRAAVRYAMLQRVNIMVGVSRGALLCT